MPDFATTRIGNSRFRLAGLAPRVMRLQVVNGRSEFRDESWSVVSRDLAKCEVESVERDDALLFGTSELLGVLRKKQPELRLVDDDGNAVLNAVCLNVGKSGSSFEIPLETEDLVFGLGSGTGSLNRRETHKELWNIDVLGHASCIHPALRNLYQSIPFVIILRNGRATGVFWDDVGRQHWDFKGSRIRAEGAAKTLDIYLIDGPTMPEVLDAYTRLTGRPAMPPRWGLGYQQSRYSYRSREELEGIAREFREREIPCDVLYLDIDHMDEHRVFTFGESFPKPKEMLKGLADNGFKVSAIVDPGVKDDRKFDVLKRGRAKNAFVKKSGSRADFVGEVWPGPSRFPDFTNAAVRKWWASEQTRHQRLGLAGFWNDMNEPSVFNAPGKTLPEDSRHKTDFGPRTHREVHNAYGTLMAQTSREGALKAAPKKRPFIVSRGGNAGIQRHAAVWTGDNSSCWEHLAESVPMLLNLGLSGVPICGADAGGFLDDCTGELLARWTQLAAFTPFFRNHANNESCAQEPWVFGEEVESICRGFISLRYQLLPYIYSAFAEAAANGTPIMRPLAWHHANDPIAAKCGDQFLFGRDLMVAPVLQKDATARSIYFPKGLWFDFWTGAVVEGGQHIARPVELATCPLYVRGGAIVPMAVPRQFIDPEERDSEIHLHIWLGGRGEFDWYEDDGESLCHADGEFSRRCIEMADLDDRGFIRFGSVEGSHSSDVKIWRIALHGLAEEFAFTANNQAFEPDYDPETGVATFLLENCADEFTIRWQ